MFEHVYTHMCRHAMICTQRFLIPIAYNIQWLSCSSVCVKVSLCDFYVSHDHVRVRFWIRMFGRTSEFVAFVLQDFQMSDGVASMGEELGVNE